MWIMSVKQQKHVIWLLIKDSDRLKDSVKMLVYKIRIFSQHLLEGYDNAYVLCGFLCQFARVY